MRESYHFDWMMMSIIIYIPYTVYHIILIIFFFCFNIVMSSWIIDGVHGGHNMKYLNLCHSLYVNLFINYIFHISQVQESLTSMLDLMMKFLNVNNTICRYMRYGAIFCKKWSKTADLRFQGTFCVIYYFRMIPIIVVSHFLSNSRTFVQPEVNRRIWWELAFFSGCTFSPTSTSFMS